MRTVEDLLTDEATLDGPFTDKETGLTDLVLTFPSKDVAFEFAQAYWKLRMA